MRFRAGLRFRALSPSPSPQEGEGRESGYQRLHDSGGLQPAGDGRGGKHATNQGAAYAAGQRILAGQIEVANRRSGPQPASLEALRGVVEAIDLPLLIAAEILSRKR